MAAENGVPGVLHSTPLTRFNEAAAHGRGKLQGVITTVITYHGFNEAAAHGRGKPGHAGS